MKIEAVKQSFNNLNFKGGNVQKEKSFETNTKPSGMLQTALLGAGIAGLAIVAICQRNKINKILKNSNGQKTVYSYTASSEPLIPYKIVDFSKTKLVNAFNEAKTGFISFLSSLNSEPEKVKEFLFAVTADKKISQDFVKEVISDPRKSTFNLKILEEKIGGKRNLLEWLQAPKGYNDAYNRYIMDTSNKLLEIPSGIDELIKISPNWHLHILLDGSTNFSLGKLPKVFQELGDFTHFAKWVDMQEFTLHEPKTLEYSGKFFEIVALNNGKSGKVPYKIKFLNSNDEKEYVLKIQKTWGCNNPFAKECLSYRSDSTFTNAQIDYYLTMHNCENSPKMYYFDYASNASLYEFVKGKHPKGLNNILKANQHLRDLNSLGIYYNDACACNFIEVDGVLKIIDIGDSSFIDPLRPGAKGYNLQLPNWCGAGLPNLSMKLVD